MNFFQSKLGGPTDGQALGKKNKLWEGSGTVKNNRKKPGSDHSDVSSAHSSSCLKMHRTHSQMLQASAIHKPDSAGMTECFASGKAGEALSSGAKSSLYERAWNSRIGSIAINAAFVFLLKRAAARRVRDNSVRPLLPLLASVVSCSAVKGGRGLL